MDITMEMSTCQMSQKRKIDYKTIALFQSIAGILEPPPDLKVSDWADSYRKLSAESSAEPGNWRTSRAEYQREIMNAVNDAECQDVAIKSSAQVGKTEILLNILGYYVDYDPTSIMVVHPTIVMGEDFSKDRLAPMIRDTPVLREKIKDPKSRDSSNTILHKKFPGGTLTIAGSNSPASLASRPIQVLLCDEIDRYPASAGSEGNPLRLAEKRTNTFWNRKRVKVSTPTLEGSSQIDIEFQKGSEEEYCVRCPSCGTYQPYDFKRLEFRSLRMECKNCSEKLSEQEWKEQPHRWIAKHPERRRFRSFHLNEMVSPWKSWEEILEDYRAAKKENKETGSVEALKVFYNTSLGEVWRELGEGADDEELANRREIYMADIPDGVVVVTAGVDVQDDRLEVERVGWNRKYQSWGLYRDIIFEDPSKEQTWEHLEELLDAELHFEDGTELNVAATCVDTGGHYTNNVYKFIKKMRAKGKRIYGVKGYAGVPGIPLIYKKTKVEIKNTRGKPISSTEIFILGVDAGKEDIIARLNVKKPEDGGYCHFPSNKDRGYNERYFKGLTAEEKVTTTVRGKIKTIWKKKSGVPNEPLDMRNYAYAALEILKPSWDTLEKKLMLGINYMKASKKRKSKKYGTVNQGIEV